MSDISILGLGKMGSAMAKSRLAMSHLPTRILGHYRWSTKPGQVLTADTCISLRYCNKIIYFLDNGNLN